MSDGWEEKGESHKDCRGRRREKEASIPWHSVEGGPFWYKMYPQRIELG